MVIDIGELKITAYPDRGKGGQHVGTWPHGVRVEHVVTGIVAIVDTARSQHTNLQIAKDMILTALTHPKI